MDAVYWSGSCDKAHIKLQEEYIKDAVRCITASKIISYVHISNDVDCLYIRCPFYMLIRTTHLCGTSLHHVYNPCFGLVAPAFWAPVIILSHGVSLFVGWTGERHHQLFKNFLQQRKSTKEFAVEITKNKSGANITITIRCGRNRISQR